MQKLARITLCLLGVAIFVGCKVGPDYHQPDTKLPDQYGYPSTQPAVDLNRWWDNFHDPGLSSLIERATASNLDLKLATARIREARAARGISEAGLWPTVDLDGSYSRNRKSLNLGLPANQQSNRNTDLYQAGFDASWEIDVFGGVRREVEAANADIESTIENRRDVLVSLLGEVARNYIVLRGNQRVLTITRANLASQLETVKLTQARFNAGIVGELDVARAKALADTTASQIPTFQVSVEQAIHRLSVLLGTAPSTLAEELGPEGKIPVGVSSLPIGLPSDLLRRRADIRRAERNLAAQTARIGVATADLFPRFSLTGSFGLQSNHTKDFFESDSIFWFGGPAVKWNIFDAGKFRSNIEVQNALQEQALVNYEQTVLNSLEEVENAITNFEHEQERRVSLDSAAQSNRRAVQLANDLYSRGLTDYLSVQQAQRDLLVAEEQLTQSESLVSGDLVALYKALGGGWESFEEPPK